MSRAEWMAVALLLAAAPVASAQVDDIGGAHADESAPRFSSTQGAILEDLQEWNVRGAAKLVRELEKTEPNDPGTLYLEARVAFLEGRYDDAVKLYSRALGSEADNSDDYKLALAARSEMEGSVTEDSAHFVLRYQPGKDAALVPYALDTLEKSYSALSHDLHYLPKAKIRVELLSSPGALARVSSLSDEAVRTTGTIALCKYNRLLVTTPRALLRGYDWQDTLNHELTHYFIMHKTGNTVPIWVHEGIAKLEETRWRGAAGLSYGPAQRLLLWKALKHHKLVTFKEMSPSMALLPSQEEAAVAYAEVVTAMMFVRQKKGMAGIRAVLDGFRRGDTDREAIAHAMGEPFPEFVADWKAHLFAQGPPKLAPAVEKLVFLSDPSEQRTQKERVKDYDRGELGLLPNEDARKHAHLGELLRSSKRYHAAKIEYEKAVALVGDTYPALARKYALTLEDLQLDSQAEEVLGESLAAFPEDETNHLLYGLLLVHSGQYARAIKHLLMANQRDPFDQDIHLGLLTAAVKTGNQALKAQEVEVLQILRGNRLTWSAPAPPLSAARAFLRIESPGGGEVFVDGVDTHLTSPVFDHPLPAGKHDVKLVLPGGTTIEHTLDFPPDEVTLFRK